MHFEPRTTDFTLSPYTGLTRESWLEAAHYLLDGVFRHVGRFEDPVIVARTETEITYPHLSAAPEAQKAEQRAEIFEGLTRTLLIAAPLLKNEPDATSCGIRLADYYRAQILRACTPDDELYVGSYEDMCALTNRKGAPCFQQTVETCALVIGLWACREQIWDTYSRAEKDTIAALLSGYAHAHTVPQNWRFFNMLDLAFLHAEGYPIDEEIMVDHAASTLAYYAGNGWYRDGHTFDYYSVWAFSFYAPLWNVWYGYAHMPVVAAAFEKNSHELMKTYADAFDADGHMNAWGRSTIYRFAALSAFDGNLLLPSPSLDCGRARRIASGCLLQFLSRDDVLQNGVPALGFYGQFPPLVQGYSCAESVYWMGKAFLSLLHGADHPYWTQVESDGTFEELPPLGVKTTVLDGPALAYTNHQANGTTVLRSGKFLKPRGSVHDADCYGKLCYSTKYPWESAAQDKVRSMQYVLHDEVDDNLQIANLTAWCGEKHGVLYRRQYFDFDWNKDMTWTHAVSLADFAVPYGIFRADKLRLFRRPVRITLGSFGFPDNGTQVEFRQKDGARAVVLKGADSQGKPKSLAFCVFAGFDALDLLHASGTNQDSANSIVPYAVAARKKEYGYEPALLLSQTLTREDHDDFTDDELFPLRRVLTQDPRGYGVYGKVILEFIDGTKKVLDFDQIEGNLHF